jgi:hypothetical protein
MMAQSIRARLLSCPRKSCASAARPFKFPQKLQSHPGYLFIETVLSQALHNQHFHNCGFHSTSTPLDATLTKKSRGRGLASHLKFVANTAR